MISKASIYRLGALLALTLGGMQWASAQEAGKKEKPADKPAAADPRNPEEAPITQGLSSFILLLPINEKSTDVRIPSFKNGVPDSLLRALTMMRMDEENLSMEKLDIRMYDQQDRERDLRVQLVTANYHIPTQLLSSDQRSRISRQDFQLEGDNLIFDTVTQQGKLTGRVQMIIHDSGSFMGKSAPAPGTEPNAPATADPDAAEEEEAATPAPAPAPASTPQKAPSPTSK